MPRLDNGNQQVIDVFSLDYNPDDPGYTPPVDLCVACASGWREKFFCAHPPYDKPESGRHSCFDCGDILLECDD